MENTHQLWLKYNEYSNKLAGILRTNNIAGEYAEYLAHTHYGGKLLKISGSSSDIKGSDGNLYQVKCRRMKKLESTQLSIIRSWNFHFLVVILFKNDGLILKALEVPVDVAKEYGVINTHQNGWVITTNQKFLNDIRSKDITVPLSKIHNIDTDLDNVQEVGEVDESFELRNSEEKVLPIEFQPNDISEFKELLLLHKKALITVFYNGGNSDKKEWIASRITEKSDIIHNLRSRIEFRQGNWQEANVNRIKVEILKNN